MAHPITIWNTSHHLFENFSTEPLQKTIRKFFNSRCIHSHQFRKILIFQLWIFYQINIRKKYIVLSVIAYLRVVSDWKYKFSIHKMPIFCFFLLLIFLASNSCTDLVFEIKQLEFWPKSFYCLSLWNETILQLDDLSRSLLKYPLFLKEHEHQFGKKKRE